MRVGLVWAGNPAHKNDRRRSMPVEFLASLLAVDQVDWVSLQVGPRAADLNRLTQRGTITDLSQALVDYRATAAALEELDLLISVDTSVVHLAGALGRPVWMMAAYAADWRWLTDREDSPWYPSLRIFRQSKPGDWGGVVSRVESALATRPAQR